METIVDFSPESVKVPFSLRCAAFCIDYMVLMAVPVVWLLVGKFFSENGAVRVGPAVWATGIILFLVNFVVDFLSSGVIGV